MNLPTLPVLGTLTKVDFSRVQTVFAPAGAVIVSLVVLIFVVWPKFGQAFSIRAENEQLVDRISLVSDKVQILESLDKNILKQQLVASEGLLPSDKAVFTFIRQVENSASASGVVLSKVDAAPGAVSGAGQTTGMAAAPGPTPSGLAVPAAGGESAEPAAKIQVKVLVTSDYKSLVNFIERISALARISSVRDLTVASTSASGEAAPLRSSIVIDAYYRILPRELGSIESPVEDLTAEEEKILARVRQIAVSEPTLPTVTPVSPGGRSDLFAPF